MDESLILIDNHLFIKPECLNHEYVSGNKLRKLKYNILEAKNRKNKVLLTFGGAYSNHIAAVAYSGFENGFETIGIIRGEELQDKVILNPTLAFAKSHGMQIKFVSRAAYRNKTSKGFIENLHHEFGDFYLIPEGGTNEFAILGCEEILDDVQDHFDYICCPVGTGGTICGLINSSSNAQKILGFSALKGDFLNQEIAKFAKQSNWELVTDYHFGGYGKVNIELIEFMNRFKHIYNVTLDPIYTGKMMFGIFDLRKKGILPENSKILAIHTGGLQGIKGMNIKLKQQKMPLIVE